MGVRPATTFPNVVDRWYGRLPPVGRGLRSVAFRDLYERAINDVLRALDIVEVTYWVTEGTLIGLLRYGRNDHPATRRSVDHDVDVMVEVASPAEWERVAVELSHHLGAAGWSDFQMMTTSLDAAGRRDKLRGWLRGTRFSRTRCDIHSYVVDEERFVAISHDRGVCYPFQRWSGRLPLSLVHPLGRVRCYQRAAPAPRRPFEILRGWNDGEYDHECLALPRRRLGLEEISTIIAITHELDADGFLSMKDELVRCGYVAARS
jgi:hypothetical protein